MLYAQNLLSYRNQPSHPSLVKRTRGKEIILLVDKEPG